MEQALAATPATHRYLDYLPVALFGSVMGLTGLSVAWRLVEVRYGTPAWIANVIAGIAATAFLALGLAYLVKLISATDAVRAEFNHPIAGNLFGTFLISILLLPILLAPFNLMLARVLWIIGTVCMIGFAWRSVSRWVSVRHQPIHATPAWVVPVVGLLDIPLALPSLSLPPLPGVMVFSLAVGLFFAIPVFTLVLARLVFEEPMPDALQPILLILVAPFSVGFSAYVTTTGQVDLFAQSLYFLMLFILAVLLGRLTKLTHCCPFRVSWWAVSFPLAASAIAALRFSAAVPTLFSQCIAWSLLALATLVIIGLLARTLFGIARGELKALS